MDIIVAPDKRLNEVSLKVEEVNKEIISILDKMLDCMYKNNGIGLAAPQVGILKRVFHRKLSILLMESLALMKMQVQ